MPATTMTVTTTTAAGTVLPAPAAVDFANGNQFLNANGRATIEIVNGAGAPITATVVTNAVYAVGAALYPIADLAITITNGTTRICGPFDKALFNDSNNLVQITWSSGTTITARVVELGSA